MTADNPVRRFAVCPISGEGKCQYFEWVDPEWDFRTYAMLVKFIRKKEKAEDQAMQWEKECERLVAANIKLNKQLEEMKEKLEKKKSAYKQLVKHLVGGVAVVLAPLLAGLVTRMYGWNNVVCRDVSWLCKQVGIMW